MSTAQPPRPFRDVPVAGTAPPPVSRHETVLPPEPAEAAAGLATALTATGDSGRRVALARLAGLRPGFLEVWARLSEQSLIDGDGVAAYAYARVAYHRGLDRLRREGWGGTGLVRWAQPSNRGFLRGLHALLAAAAALAEEDEATRCRAFLIDLDPDDALGVAAYPEVPGPGWSPPVLP